RRLRGAAGAPRARAPSARARIRRQGGLPRRLRRAAVARAAGSAPGRDPALRPPLDLARERRRPLGGAAALVPGLAWADRVAIGRRPSPALVQTAWRPAARLNYASGW